MPSTKRVAVWFGLGLDNALAARAELGVLKTDYPEADRVLFGPAGSLYLFEMDQRVAAYIPLRGLAPRRPAQSRFSYYLEKRAQLKKLRDLQIDVCVGVSVVHPAPTVNKLEHKDFQHVQKMLGVGGIFIQKAMSEFLQLERPVLEAGPQALAYATQFYRKSPPNMSKAVMLLHSADLETSLDMQCEAMQVALAKQSDPMHITVAVVVGNDRLLARRLNQAQPNWIQIGMAEAMGLVAYADRVVSNSAQITLICCEMGRSDRLVLVKSDS